MKLTIVLISIFCVLVFCHRDSNQRFKACCARQKAADKECKRRFCDFNVINQKNMVHFLNTCTPRNATVRLMWDCATSAHDHTDCCKKNGVSPLCLRFCNASRGAPADFMNQLFCLNFFNPIRDCFRSHLEKHPNIFGDA